MIRPFSAFFGRGRAPLRWLAPTGPRPPALRRWPGRSRERALARFSFYVTGHCVRAGPAGPGLPGAFAAVLRAAQAAKMENRHCPLRGPPGVILSR